MTFAYVRNVFPVDKENKLQIILKNPAALLT